PSGYTPPSIPPTRRQLMSAGFPFCSLQATTQHLQPIHFPMSKWNRYCSPVFGARPGISAGAAGIGLLTRSEKPCREGRSSRGSSTGTEPLLLERRGRFKTAAQTHHLAE